jgi:hypothetical protein
MGVLRAFGYFIAILILIGGVLLLPFLGIPLIIGAIIMMWFLHKGGQVTSMKKDLESLRKLEEENKRRELNRQWNDAIKRKDQLDRTTK